MCPAPARPRLRVLLLWAAPILTLGCGGGGGTDIVLPSLTIRTETSGPEPDSEGYTVTIDGLQAKAIGPSATLVIERLPDGQHTVELSGIAPNCSAGENPRPVTIAAGTTADAAFAIICVATTAGLQVVTTTTGPGTDPDGFTLLLDGADQGRIGASVTATLPGIAPGTHTVGLSGLAANCAVSGENPRSVTVAPGETADLAFSITCATPGSALGTLEVSTTTSGPNPDPDGYAVQLDGGASQPIGTTSTVPLANLRAAEHTVRLLGLAANCTVAGPNPARATVPSGGSVRVAFAVSCTARPPTEGSIRITVTTSGSPPDPDGYTVRVDGGATQTVTANDNRTIAGLAIGNHSVRLAGLVANCTTADNPRNVAVSAGQTASTAFAVTCASPSPTLNLKIQNLYVTQSTQTLTGDVTLVQDRAAYLRVFVVANGTNTAKPSVRVRFSRNGSVVQTLTISAPGGSTPTSVQEGTLGSSWNAQLPTSLIQPGLSISAEVDPGNSIAESNEGDNSFPVSGSERLTVQTVPTAKVRFVPILQTENNLQGAVGNPDDLLDVARRIYPLRTVQSDVHEVFSVSGPLQFNDANGQWNQILSDLEGLRVTESSDWTYFGMVRVDYAAGQNGTAFVGGTAPQAPRAAVGSDRASTVAEVVAHELGHTWGQEHAPCGQNLDPLTVDKNYPYTGGETGKYGFDVERLELKPTTLHDIMSYCPNRWVSDYTYERVLQFRATQQPAAFARAAAQQQPSLLISGRIVNGQPVLEPVFQIVARPSLPAKPGPYSVVAAGADGVSLFTLSFDVTAAADDPSGARHFAFVVPTDPTTAARLSALRLTGPGVAVEARARQPALLRTGAAPADIVATREGARVVLRWDAAAHPMIMVRDPDTGAVLSFARGGNARVWTRKNQLDLVLSDGVQSTNQRISVTGP